MKDALEQEFYSEDELLEEARNLWKTIEMDFFGECERERTTIRLRKDHVEVLEKMCHIHNSKNHEELTMNKYISDIVIPGWLKNEFGRNPEPDF